MPYPSKTDRQTILSAAVKDLARRGVRDLSLRNIATSLDLTPNAIYRYFSDRSALEAALANEAARRLELALRKAAKSPSSNNRSSPRPTTRKSRPASRSLQESRGFVPLAEIAQSQVLSPVPMRIKGVEIASCASATGHDRSANER